MSNRLKSGYNMFFLKFPNSKNFYLGINYFKKTQDNFKQTSTKFFI